MRVSYRLHIPRLWKRTALIALGFTMLVMGAVYTVRVLPHPGCIFLSNSRTLDLLSGRTTDRDRWQELGGMYLRAPDTNRSIGTSLSRTTGESTIYLWLDSAAMERITLQEHVLAKAEIGSPSFTWSSDGHYVAYLWRGVDSHYYLSAATSDGGNVQTVPFNVLNNDDSEFPEADVFGWSADNSYLLTRIGSDSIMQGDTYALWALPDLRPVATPLDGEEGLQVAWSPQGHRIAALIREANTRTSRLLLFTPDEDTKTVNVALPYFSVNYIFWSPDGRYLTLAYLVEAAQGVHYWSYDIYSAEGEPLFIGITAELADFLTSGAGGPPTIRAAWSKDSRLWVYLKESGREERRRVDIMALDVETRLHRITAPNLVADFLSTMFYVETFQPLSSYRPLGLTFSVPRNNKVIIPRWKKGKITVELADVDGRNRITLIDIADRLLVDETFGFLPMWWGRFSEDFVTIAWERGEGEARRQYLTIIEPGSSYIFTSEGYEYLTTNNFVYYAYWVTFLGGSEDNSQLYLYDTHTHELHLLVTGLPAENGWQVIPLDDKFSLLVVILPSRTEYTGGDVYYVTDDGQPGRLLAEGIDGFPAWSPDRSRIGVIQHDQPRQYYLELMDTEGNDLMQLGLKRPGSNPSLNGWSNCEA